MLHLVQKSTSPRSACVRFISTVQPRSSTSSKSNSPSDDKTTPPLRPGTWKTRRPHINPKSPRKWNRPLALGVLPAFDEALRYIRQDYRALRAEVQHNRSALREAETSPIPDTELIDGLKEKLATLEVQSEVNLPEVRWYFRNGLCECPYLRNFFQSSCSPSVQRKCPNQFTGTSPKKNGEVRETLTSW